MIWEALMAVSGKQCAAVKTYLGSMIVPPHRTSFRITYVIRVG